MFEENVTNDRGNATNSRVKASFVLAICLYVTYLSLVLAHAHNWNLHVLR